MLGTSRHELVSMPFHLPKKKLITCNVTCKNESLFLQALLNNELIYIADGFFSLERSHSMSTACFTSTKKSDCVWRFYIISSNRELTSLIFRNMWDSGYHENSRSHPNQIFKCQHQHDNNSQVVLSISYRTSMKRFFNYHMGIIHSPMLIRHKSGCILNMTSLIGQLSFHSKHSNP